MKLTLFLTADYANITGDGKLNVMGVFNRISSYNFPARHSTMHLIAKLEAELGEYNKQRGFTIILMDEDGHQVMDISGQLQTPKGELGKKPEVNIILELKDIVFPKPGPYQFVILIDKDHKGELSLYVEKLEAPKPSGE